MWHTNGKCTLKVSSIHFCMIDEGCKCGNFQFQTIEVSFKSTRILQCQASNVVAWLARFVLLKQFFVALWGEGQEFKPEMKATINQLEFSAFSTKNGQHNDTL